MATAYQIKEQQALYYLTLQIVDWIDVFSRQIYRDIVIENLVYCQKNKGLEIYAYVIMSNHIHLIVRTPENELSAVLRDFKSYTSKKIIEAIENGRESRKEWMLSLLKEKAATNKRNSKYQLWTHENHAVHLYSNEFIKQKLDYIHNNPVRAGIVKLPEDYLYSSATNYADNSGLIDVIPLNIVWKTVF